MTWKLDNSGQIACALSGSLTEFTAPHPEEAEITLFGPGYGECIVVHAGGGDWIIVDSLQRSQEAPIALQYLGKLGLDPAQSIRFIVATHWHDDHMRGIGELVSQCPEADFCCANALGSKEFMSAVAAYGKTCLPDRGLGELYRVLTHLDSRDSQPVWATASRRVHRSINCEIWSLSPDDRAFTSFLKSIAPSSENRTKRGVHLLSPNSLSVALFVRFSGGASCLLGADLERRGWSAILRDERRPQCKSSVFKVPHHGSANAHLQGVWDELLDPEPIAILAPWYRGRGALPRKTDVDRILAQTPHAYSTTSSASGAIRRDRWIKKRLKGTKVHFAPESSQPGMIRLRRSMAEEESWRVDLLEPARHLKDFETYTGQP